MHDLAKIDLATKIGLMVNLEMEKVRTFDALMQALNTTFWWDKRPLRLKIVDDG